ncbi:diguanylate cyclase/phosphodiesterase (GGDEF & EAL domains) with PAS/PAC sensor(s) [Alloactinosynnema sp. L-07]|uniref:tetratricopeptide repeat protein n=1 Tax=Alloactinosynnema sp. L-07 TaxID=1653480 RepID=UPI00065F02F8|nr:tetratricopeptide repeat protein [Alloactinosynnema sp. L-07]CRK59394.1 diguanylate cyclase/phosphodiesterase (GGDEF & EAL domains) with PAS/PAC sensor(s) [Alloactinosynnema sp. L-07]
MNLTRSREVLLQRLAELSAEELTPGVRLAIAEAEFRLAIDQDTAPEEGVERLRRSIAHDPFNPKLPLHLGRLLHRAGRHGAAVSAYRAALRLAPRSRRAHVLLAQVLLESGKEEREIGQALLAALNADDAAARDAAVVALDAVLDQARTGAEPGKRAKSEAKARPGKHSATDLWQLSLLDQLARPKPLRPQVDAHLGTGSSGARTGSRVAEFAIACVSTLVAGDSVRDVRALARSGLSGHDDHPAVALLDAILDLVETDDAADFVASTTRLLDDKVLPIELACWAHFTKFGPGGALAAEDALRILDRYPGHIQDTDCFVELRIAVLDGLARAAAATGHTARAKLLWRETVALDPYRVPVAMNLALMAARTRSADEYGPAWERLSELLYLHAAGAGDVQLYLDERRTLHLALSQQSRSRYCAPSPRPYPTDAEVAAWVADDETVRVWLSEWDLYYLNARLGFRSPSHVLGVAEEPTDEALADARDALLGITDLTLRGRDWAGVTVFADLVADRVRAAHTAASDPQARARDEYADVEKARADALADETLRRGILLRGMMTALIDRGSGEYLALGCEIARRQLALPWSVLTPICIDRGMISDDIDLVKVFRSDLVALSTKWNKPAPTSQEEWASRLVDLDVCVEIMPLELRPKVERCALLQAADRPDDAYAAAVSALDDTVDTVHDDDAVQLRRDLVTLVDNTAVSPVPVTPQGGFVADEPTAAACRRALTRFPRSGGLSRLLADVLLKLGGEANAREAVTVLSAAIDVALDHECRVESETLLATTRGAAAREMVLTKIREISGPAIDRVDAAITRLREETDDTADAKVALRAAIADAITAVGEAVAMAERANLTDEAQELRARLDRLTASRDQLDAEED